MYIRSRTLRGPLPVINKITGIRCIASRTAVWLDILYAMAYCSRHSVPLDCRAVDKYCIIIAYLTQIVYKAYRPITVSCKSPVREALSPLSAVTSETYWRPSCVTQKSHARNIVNARNLLQYLKNVFNHVKSSCFRIVPVADKEWCNCN